MDGISVMVPFLAVLMMVVGAAFIYLILRSNARPVPADGLQWLGVGISALLVAFSGLLLVLALIPEQPFVLTDPTDVSPAELDQPAGNFSFRLVEDNTEKTLADYRGNVVLLNFWGTWCLPCIGELPELNRLHETYADDGLVVLTISDETRAELQDFSMTLPLKTVSGYIVSRTVLPEPFQRTSAVRPATFVIDRQGVIRAYLKGAGNFDYFEQLVQPYLQAPIAAR